MMRAAVLVSGGGTNLQALLDAQKAGLIPGVEFVLVVSNRRQAYALERARLAGIEGVYLPTVRYEEPGRVPHRTSGSVAGSPH